MADQQSDDTYTIWRFSLTPLKKVMILLILVSVLIHVYAICSGLGKPVLDFSRYAPEGYKTFYQVPAWILFPFYFVVVYFVVRQSWDAFNAAWLKLPQTGVLQRLDGEEVKDEEVYKMLSRFNHWRIKWFIPLSLIAGIACMYMDSERERDTMIFNGPPQNEQYVDAYDGPKTTLAGQIARACESPDFMSKWLWEKLAKADIDATQICSHNGKTEKAQVVSREAQFKNRRDKATELINKRNMLSNNSGNENIKIRNSFEKPESKQWGPVLLMHIEDAILISFGWLIFFQCIAHSVFFWYFERLNVAKNDGKPLCIKLNSQSAFGEFGLQHWNHALNNLYWYFALGLIIPIMSRLSQPDLKDLDTSQVILQFAIPILVAVPMVTTILSRQNRLPSCWKSLNEADIPDYKKQRLWPLDENWSSKLGVVLAFVILSLSFGFNLVTLV